MRPPSVSNEMIRQIRRLLKAGRSLREIERLTGVSDTTIGRIDSGELKPRQRPIAVPKKLVRERKTTGGYVRCQCGGRVKKPCKLCGVRKWMRENGRRAAKD